MASALRQVAGASMVLVVTMSIVVAVAIVREHRRQQGLYWYDVTHDQEVRFSAAHESLAVDVSRTGFRWPPAEAECDTALLRLRVESDLGGQWFEPSVLVASSLLEPFEQYLERGVSGERYLNLSPLCARQPAEEAVTLGGRHLDWEPQQAELLRFRNPDRDAEPVLVLAPHPDDAEIAAFGLYQSRRSIVVTVTAGDYSGPGLRHLEIGPEQQRRLRGRLRTWDSVAIPLWGGVDPDDAINLGYASGSLAGLYEPGGSAAADDLAVPGAREVRTASGRLEHGLPSTWQGLVAELSDLVARTEPAIIVAPHPVLDLSLEHRFTTIALLEALRGFERSPTLWLYTNHAQRTEYYPFGPSDGWVTLPPSGEKPALLAGVYSHPVPPPVQLDKLFALEAMHDLRPAPHPERGEHTRRMFRRARRILGDLWNDPRDYYTYYRRAARPNELFFVYRERDVDALWRSTESTRSETRD